MVRLPQWLRSASRPIGEKYYSSLPADDDEVYRLNRKPSATRRWSHFWTRRRIIAAGILTFFSTQIILAMNRSSNTPFPYSVPTNITADKERLHILIPANYGNFELCKLMLSLSILGYPTPHLVNWGMEFTSTKQFTLAGGSHLAKISGVIKWLWALEKEQMGDIVLILDAYDVQFQLPPEVLINQYYRSNYEWNEHRAQKPGMRRAMREHGLYQTVIFASDKKCSPHDWQEPWCYLQPKSPLPDDLYGNWTDTNRGWDYDRQQTNRPRWLNSGVVMGPAEDILDIFMRSYQQMSQERFGSDQSLFNLVFGEQEYMREFWRQQSRQWFDSGPSRISDWVPRRLRKRNIPEPNQLEMAPFAVEKRADLDSAEPNTPGMAPIAAEAAKEAAVEAADTKAAEVAQAAADRTVASDATPAGQKPKPAPKPAPKQLTDEEKTEAVLSPFSPDHHLMEPAFDRPRTEYHMGLDYWSRLSKTDKSSFWELRIFTYNTNPPTGNLTRDARDCNSPDPTLLSDLLPNSGIAPPPVPADFPAPEGHPPPPTTWKDCALWTDICSGSIPVAAHHNGFKIFREFHWTQMWFHRYMKAFLEYRGAQQQAAEDEATAARAAGKLVLGPWQGRDGTHELVEKEGRSADQSVFKMRDVNVANAWTPGGRKLGLDDICAKDFNMVFHGCMWGNGWDCEKEKADKAAAAKPA